mmetsp:Transcript_52207/g.156691  ORF Transcript_52207/g.156691 Transcript_52207/m.156691 type:complete len:522 (+) Transcript_52207:287-1852(+)
MILPHNMLRYAPCTKPCQPNPPTMPHQAKLGRTLLLSSRVRHAHPVHQPVRLLVHPVDVHAQVPMLQPPSLVLVPPRLAHGGAVPVQRQGRESTPLRVHQDALRGPSPRPRRRRVQSGPHQREGALPVLVVHAGPGVVDPSGPDALAVGAASGDHGGAIRRSADRLLVVPGEAAVADNPSIGEDELAEGRNVVPVCGELVLVAAVQTLLVFVFFLHALVVRHVLPLGAVVVLAFVHVFLVRSLLSLILLSSRLLLPPGRARQEFLVSFVEVVKYVELLQIDAPLVPQLAMAGVDHVTAAALPRRKGLLAVQAGMSKLDLFVAVAEESLEVSEVLGIGNEEAVRFGHVREVELQRGEGGVVKEALVRIDLRGLFLFFFRLLLHGPFFGILLGLAFLRGTLLLLRVHRLRGILSLFRRNDGGLSTSKALSYVALSLSALLILLPSPLLSVLILQVSPPGAPFPLLPFLPRGQRRLQPRVEVPLGDHGETGLTALQVVPVPVAFVVLCHLGPGGEDFAGGSGGG